MFLKNENINGLYKVILSIDDNINYSFFAPIVSLLWNKFNYAPILFVVWDKDWIINKTNILIIEKSFEFGANIKFLDVNYIKTDSEFNGYNLSTIAQISRFCSSCLVHDYDYCLTSDIDMLPLNRYYFFHQDILSKLIHIFYSNGYHHTRYPICYLGMKSKIWKEVMGINSDDIYEAILGLLNRGLVKNSVDDVQWGYDEVLFFNQIKNSKYYQSDCQMIDRTMYLNPAFLNSKNRKGIPKTLPLDRLDRSNWKFHGDIDHYVDAHCKRPGFAQENWKEIRYLLSFVLDSNELKLIDDYYDKFMEYLNV